MKEILLKAKFIKLHPTGEVDVEVDNGGKPLIITVFGTEVLLKPLFTHWSDCSLHNEPAYPTKPCDCGVGIGGQPK